MNNLKKIRKERNLTQADVAKGTGLSITWIGFAEKHEGLVSVLTKLKITDYLNMELDEVFPEEMRKKEIKKARNEFLLIKNPIKFIRIEP